MVPSGALEGVDRHPKSNSVLELSSMLSTPSKVAVAPSEWRALFPQLGLLWLLSIALNLGNGRGSSLQRKVARNLMQPETFPDAVSYASFGDKVPSSPISGWHSQSP